MDLAAHFETHRERTLFVAADSGRRHSYGEFAQLVERVRGLLAAHGCGPGERVALMLPNSVELAACYFACLLSGAVATPLAAALSDRDTRYIVESVAPRLIVLSVGTRARATRTLAGLARPQLCLCTAAERALGPEPGDALALDLPRLWDGAPPAPPAPAEALHRVSVIYFTSGTTGRPKGVMHRGSGLLAAAEAFARASGFDADTRMHHVWPMTNSTGFLNTVLCPFVVGGSVVLNRPFDARTVLNFWGPARAHDANSLWLSPAMLAALLRVDRDEDGARFARARVRQVCCGTEPLPRRTKEEFHAKYGAPVLESYGLTETLFLSAQHLGDHDSRAVGRVLPGCRVEVLDEQGLSAPPGAAGRIVAVAPWHMQGYWDAANAGEPLSAVGSAAPLRVRFETGDLGRLSPDGELFITGRAKDLIIRGGLNISPRAVEDVLLEVPQIEEAAVVGTPHPLQGEEVVAFLKLAAGASWDELQPQVLKHARSQLAAASVPTRWKVVAELPRTPNGKVQKNLLREQAA